ncbi:hypothetical protein [Nocardia sp. NPDC046763]|uniref:hypothetical protein n=1 Tax=Nocardia sp. NPDC046763 TaxID=3155256 RepID=UPI0033EB841F
MNSVVKDVTRRCRARSGMLTDRLFPLLVITGEQDGDGVQVIIAQPGDPVVPVIAAGE